MIEVALVFDIHGETIEFHRGKSGFYIVDSRDLWEVIWEHRATLGGVAHTHPWNSPVWPSHEDVTTFAAIESGLGRRLVWPIISFIDEKHFVWYGPSPIEYKNREPLVTLRERERLLELSKI